MKSVELTPLALSTGIDLGRGDPTRGLGSHLKKCRDKVYDLPEGAGRVALRKGKFGGQWQLEVLAEPRALASERLGENTY
jgi:hypothetical protein